MTGDGPCLRYCADRLLGRDRPLGLQLPPINGAGDVPAAMSAIASGLNNGDLTAEEAAHLVHVFERYSNAIIASDLAMRLQNIETQVKTMKMPKTREMQ